MLELPRRQRRRSPGGGGGQPAGRRTAPFRAGGVCRRVVGRIRARVRQVRARPVETPDATTPCRCSRAHRRRPPGRPPATAPRAHRSLLRGGHAAAHLKRSRKVNAVLNSAPCAARSVRMPRCWRCRWRRAARRRWRRDGYRRGRHRRHRHGVGPVTVVRSPVSVRLIVAGCASTTVPRKVTDEDGGRACAPGDLKLGMVAGSAAAPISRRAPASPRRSTTAEIVGPVGTVDVAGGRFTVLGATVKLTAATVFDDSLAGLAALRAGAAVGNPWFQRAAAGAHTATRIEAAPLATRFRLRGGRGAGCELAATTVERRAHRLCRRAARRAAGARQRRDRPGGGDGAAVRRRGPSIPSPAPPQQRRRRRFKVEGNITAMLSATAFVVDGVTVDAATAQSVSGTLAVGRQVEAEGHMSSGVHVAAEVERAATRTS